MQCDWSFVSRVDFPLLAPCVCLPTLNDSDSRSSPDTPSEVWATLCGRLAHHKTGFTACQTSSLLSAKQVQLLHSIAGDLVISLEFATQENVEFNGSTPRVSDLPLNAQETLAILQLPGCKNLHPVEINFTEMISDIDLERFSQNLLDSNQ